MRPATLVILGLGLAALLAPLHAAAPIRLVHDINRTNTSSSPQFLAEHDGQVYFYAEEGLWTSDGSKQKTILLATITSSPWSTPYPVVSADGIAFFSNQDSVLWKTDGTPDGTEPVYRFEPDWCGYKCIEPLEILGTYKSRVFFSAFESTRGQELWRSDGTPGGTRRVLDIVPGSDGSKPRGWATTPAAFFFTADDGVHGRELWVSDGYRTSTRLLEDIHPSGSSDPQELTAVGTTLFFTADDGTHGRELWLTDGTAAGTRMVKDIGPGRSSSGAVELTLFNGALFFRVDTGSGGRLWRSDGSAAGTRAIGGTRVSPGELTAAGPLLFFVGDDNRHGSELWVSDGTEAGTRLVRDIRRGREGSLTRGIPTWGLTALGDMVYFPADDGTHGFEPWRSDGTAAGTVMLGDLRAGRTGSQPSSMTAAGGILFFTADNGWTGSELWMLAGTARPKLVADLSRQNRDSNPQDLTPFGGDRLYFRADDGFSGTELWTSDGTLTGTRLVRDVCSGPCSSPRWSPVSMVEVNGTLFFNAYDNDHGQELWKSDGTNQGTVLVKDLYRQGSSYPGGFATTSLGFAGLGDLLLFGALHPTLGWELWRSDGTADGTFLIKDIRAGDRGSEPDRFRGTTDFLYFVADDGETGNELWRTDGTAAGTHLLADIQPGAGSSYPLWLTLRGDELFFTADDGSGRELWRSDGTTAGTIPVTDIGPGGDWRIQQLLNAAGRLFFLAGSYEMDWELWTTDGTAGGENRLWGFGRGDQPDDLIAAGERLFFSAPEPDAGQELWTSDGTEEGTRVVADINPGAKGSWPRAMATAADLLYFAAHSPGTGEELWRSDGTADGTRLVAEIIPGESSSYIQDIRPVGDHLYLVAGHPRYGRELWVVETGASGGSAGAVSLEDLDGLGADELAVILPGFNQATVVDAASGEILTRVPLTHRSGWQVVDFDRLPDINGNGSQELAVLAKQGSRSRVRVLDALTGERLGNFELGRGFQPLKIASAADVTGKAAVAVLAQSPKRGAVRVFVHDAVSGAPLARLSFRAKREPVDLEVFGSGARAAVVVLSRTAEGKGAQVTTRRIPSGETLGDWSFKGSLRPIDLEVLESTTGSGVQVAVLAETLRRGAARVLIGSVAGGDQVTSIRLGARWQALDLETMVLPDPANGSALPLLVRHKGDGSVRVFTRGATSEDRLGTVDFPQTSEPVDLSVVRSFGGSAFRELALLSEAECAEGEAALTIRDASSGVLLQCVPLGATAD